MAPVSNFDARLPQVLEATFVRLTDWRGSLTKILADGRYTAPGFGFEPRQILVSATERPWVLRGLHAQRRPDSESKILVPLSGRTFWTVVDLRADSRSFGRWQGFELAAEGAEGVAALQVPAGFAHGCLSLSAASSLLILADRDYTEAQGVGIAWNDPELAIDWPLGGREPELSDGHTGFGSFAAFRRDVGAL